MPEKTAKTALITGANSGLGFEAAAQFCEAGYERVILACRSEEKAEAARAELIERCGTDVFEPLIIDTSEPGSGDAAAEEIARRGHRIDSLILNAGAGSPELRTNSDGVDVVYASTLAGHHVLTLRLLELGGIAPDARIVIAGSEAARSDLRGMGMQVDDFRALASDRYGGDLTAAMVAAARAEAGGKYNANHSYANAKALVAWWAAALARRLPEGMAVYAVSPGAAMGTSFARNMPFFMRAVMVPIMRVFGPLFHISGSVATGSQRYLEATGFDASQSGTFFASPPRKMIGKLQPQDTAFLVDEELQEAGWSAVVELTHSGELERHLPPTPKASA